MKQDVLEKADEIDERAKGIDTDVGRSITALRKGYRNTRLFLLLQLVTILAVGYLFVQNQNTRNKAQDNANKIAVSQIAIEANKTSMYNGCLSGNDLRLGEQTLWSFILSIPPETPPTENQQKQIDSLKAIISKNFAPRNCDALK